MLGQGLLRSGLERLEGVRDVRLDIERAVESEQHLAVLVNHVRLSPGKQAQEVSWNSKNLPHGYEMRLCGGEKQNRDKWDPEDEDASISIG